MTTEEIQFWDEGKFDSLDKEKFDCCLIDVLSVLLACKEICKKIRQPSPCLPSDAPIRCTNFLPFPDSEENNGNNEPSTFPKCKEKTVDPITLLQHYEDLAKMDKTNCEFFKNSKDLWMGKVTVSHGEKLFDSSSECKKRKFESLTDHGRKRDAKQDASLNAANHVFGNCTGDEFESVPLEFMPLLSCWHAVKANEKMWK